MRAAIVGLAGPTLLPEERALFALRPPAGVILFGRNIGGAGPLVRLVAELRSVLPQGSVLMVDQEGGRVARLRPPEWRAHPAAGVMGARYVASPAAGARLAWVTGALIGLDCERAGFDVVCAPVLDVGTAGMTDAIGDRSFGTDPAAVAVLGQAMADGLLAAGMQPVGKHAPGHGRATVDSHAGLPRVAGRPEVEVFAVCRALPWLMTAHIVYEAYDVERAGTLSECVVGDVIRGEIGFEGLLVSDDLAMGALQGPAGERAAAALAAGCDLALHCSGDLDDTAAVLELAGDVTGPGQRRMRAARALAEARRVPLDPAALADEQARLLG